MRRGARAQTRTSSEEATPSSSLTHDRHQSRMIAFLTHRNRPRQARAAAKLPPKPRTSSTSSGSCAFPMNRGTQAVIFASQRIDNAVRSCFPAGGPGKASPWAASEGTRPLGSAMPHRRSGARRPPRRATVSWARASWAACRRSSSFSRRRYSSSSDSYPMIVAVCPGPRPGRPPSPAPGAIHGPREPGAPAPEVPGNRLNVLGDSGATSRATARGGNRPGARGIVAEHDGHASVVATAPSGQTWLRLRFSAPLPTPWPVTRKGWGVGGGGASSNRPSHNLKSPQPGQAGPAPAPRENSEHPTPPSA